MGSDGGLRLWEDGVGVGLIGGGVDRGLGQLGLVTLRPAEATLMMSFKSELRERERERGTVIRESK